MWVRGWATLPVFLIAALGGWLIGVPLAQLFDTRIWIPIGCLMDVVITAVVAVRINEGSDRHTFWDVPIEFLAFVPAALAVLTSFWVVHEEHDTAGWVIYLLPVGTIVVLVLGGCVVYGLTSAEPSPRDRDDPPRDIRRRVRLTAEEADGGVTRTVRYRPRQKCSCDLAKPRCRRCDGTGLAGRKTARITVKIPAGVKHGTIVRVVGRGEPAVGGYPASNLLISVVPPRRHRPPRTASPGGGDVLFSGTDDTTPRATAPSVRPDEVPEDVWNIMEGIFPRGAPEAPDPRSSPSGAAPPETEPSTQPRPRRTTINSSAVQVLVDDEGLTIRGTHKAPGPSVHGGRRHIRWVDVTVLEFMTDPHDPVVALHAVLRQGGREFLLDKNQLARQEWADLAKAVRTSTSGRLSIDLP